MGGDGAVLADHVFTIVLPQPAAHIGVQLLIERRQLVPESGDLRLEVGSVVHIQPHLGTVLEACGTNTGPSQRTVPELKTRHVIQSDDEEDPALKSIATGCFSLCAASIR